MTWFIHLFDGATLKHILGALLLVIPFCVVLGLSLWALGWKESLKTVVGISIIFIYVFLVGYLLQ